MRLVVRIGIVLTAGLLGAVPCLCAFLGIEELTALWRGRADPTWNDGDLGLSLVGAVALVAITCLAAVLNAATSAGTPARTAAVFAGTVSAVLVLTSGLAALVLVLL